MNLQHHSLDVTVLDVTQIEDVSVSVKPIYPMHHLMTVFYKDGTTERGTVGVGDFYRLEQSIKSQVPGFKGSIKECLKEIQRREDEKKVEVDTKRELMI